MKRIVIADISSMRLGKNIFGHYGKVAKMYCNLFKADTSVYIAGGNIYKKYFAEQNRIDLPYDCELESLNTIFGKVRFKLRSIGNGIKLFRLVENSIIVCQPYSFMSWMISLLFTRKKKSNKIYLIEYRNELDKNINRHLFRLVRHKIDGVLCPNKQIGEIFGLPYCVVTDYIYDRKEMPKIEESTEYDFGVFGIMSTGKDIKDVVDSFAKLKYKVLIAGYFGGKKDQYCINRTDNITVIDKYLSNEEYDKAFAMTRYIILPYSDAYKNQSSGVIFDVLFKGKPVLTKNYPTFRFVRDYSLGELYDKSLAEVDFEKLMNKTYEENLFNNICNFLKINRSQKEEILKLFRETNY